MAKKDYKVPAVVRALDILEFLARNQEATFTEIHTRIGIPKSSTYQIISTLGSRGYIRQKGDSVKYTLGLRLFELGTLAVHHLDIRAESIPVLRELAAKTGQTCHLGILDGDEGVYLTKLDGTQAVRLNSWEGKRMPLHSTAMGKALLAWQDPDQLEDLLRDLDFTPFTENTITGPEKLKENLRLIRERGWSMDDQENEPHIRCVSAPIRNVEEKVIAAISISGLATQFSEEYLLPLAREVRNAAVKLSRIIGSSLGDPAREPSPPDGRARL